MSIGSTTLNVNTRDGGREDLQPLISAVANQRYARKKQEEKRKNPAQADFYMSAR